MEGGGRGILSHIPETETWGPAPVRPVFYSWQEFLPIISLVLIPCFWKFLSVETSHTCSLNHLLHVSVHLNLANQPHSAMGSAAWLTWHHDGNLDMDDFHLPRLSSGQSPRGMNEKRSCSSL